ncbi:MAG: hypothetical protein QOC85_1889 [Streptomyces sp.]|nr:hypothetical protein [Streptomyces sp.]
MYLTQGLHRSLQRDPDGAATIFGDRIRTWAECADRVARLAGALGDLGLGPGDRVGMLALNSDRYYESFLAVHWAGGVINPINTRWAAPEISYAITDSETRILLVDDAFASLIPEIRAAVGVPLTVIHCGELECPEGMESYEALVAGRVPVPDVLRGGDELAAIYYTGGTTGRSRGVMLSHANLIVSAMGTISTGAFMEPTGRLLHAAPMFHLADGVTWVARNLLGGAHVILPGFDAAAVADAVERHGVTEMLLVPTMVQLLVDNPATKEADMNTLRRFVYGASPISEAVLDRAQQVLPGARFSQVYGMTELSPIATLLDDEEHTHARLRRSAGRAVPHAEVRIVDAEDHEVPRGTVGEIVSRGAHVMLGYWNRPEETATALRGGWMHTGDAGYMDEQGYVFVVDRIKDMIVSGGENVYSAEVENAVAQHPSVAACAVIGVPDDEWGERVHAVVVLKPGVEATGEEIREHAKVLIAGYKAPRSVEFAESLPLSGAGKVLKRELRRRYWSDAERQVN